MSVPCFRPDRADYPDYTTPPEGFEGWRAASGTCTHPDCIEADYFYQLYRRTPQLDREEIAADRELVREEFGGLYRE